MKLLLDEHLSPEIARQLRDRGHDVAAVGERTDLRGPPDRVHFASLPDERRAIVTRDLADFRPPLADTVRSSAETHGLVCVLQYFSLSREGIGRLVRALDTLLQTHPEADAAIAVGGEIWLEDPAVRLSIDMLRLVESLAWAPPPLLLPNCLAIVLVDPRRRAAGAPEHG